MGKKLHLYPSDQITRSVLEGVKITAACGLRKSLTREDIDAARDTSKAACAACLQSISEETRRRDVTLRERIGWTEHLEREARSARWAYTIQVSTPQTWGKDFPLVG